MYNGELEEDGTPSEDAGEGKQWIDLNKTSRTAMATALETGGMDEEQFNELSLSAFPPKWTERKIGSGSKMVDISATLNALHVLEGRIGAEGFDKVLKGVQNDALFRDVGSIEYGFVRDSTYKIQATGEEKTQHVYGWVADGDGDFDLKKSLATKE